MTDDPSPHRPGDGFLMLHFRALNAPTPFLFFTGKGGVGKTSLACATAVGLADRGSRVLLVSTDPASNLDEMLEVNLTDSPAPVPNAAGLFAMNIDPEAAAESYRTRVLKQLGRLYKIEGEIRADGRIAAVGSLTLAG